MNTHQLSETRHTILQAIKQNGAATIADLAAILAMTREAVRQQLLQLEHDELVEGRIKREPGTGGGRPSVQYTLTAKGENAFPKHYSALTIEMLDTIAALNPDTLTEVLAAMTETRVREWEPRLKGLTLLEKAEVLKGLYYEDDSYMKIDTSDGELRLIEHNCPFYDVTSQRPVLCSVTVSALTRLLGYQVVREESFQKGDGRCVFRVLLDQPVDANTFRFAVEHNTK